MFCVGTVCGLPGGMYRQYLCSGLSMVIAVIVGDIWELLRLSCLHWHVLGPCHDARWGRRGSPRDANFVLPTHLLRREVVGEGALRGRSPRTREGQIGPTAQMRGEERGNFVQRRELTMAE